jgi:uncharacterized protein YjbI with pentapeptide repeats
MSNRTSNKIRQRKENLKANKPPTFSSAPNKIWFWLFLIALVSAIGYLSYQAYTSNLPNELIILIAVVIILLSALVIWYLPKFYVQSLPNEAGKTFDRENAKLKLEDDTRKTFAQIVGGAVLLGGLVFTFNTFRLQQSTYQLQQEGQFTDRFTKAVTQIGDDKLEVRLGGLYALERIAKDSPKDHWTVMEILSAYVREKAKKKDEIVKNIESNSNTNVNGETAETKKTPKIATDVQAALTIIGRRKTEQDSKTDKINLSGTDLSGADLSKSNFSSANIRTSNLIGTNLSNSNLAQIDLTESNLTNSDLSWSNLNEAKLIRVNLTNSNMIGADLSKGKLMGSILHEANLRQVKMQSVILDTVDLSEANLYFADLRDATISHSNLFKTRFHLADLREADFYSQKPVGSVIGVVVKEELSSTNPTETIGHVAIKLVYPTFEQLEETIINENTTLQPDLETRKAELLELSKKNLEQREKEFNKK